MRSSRRSRANVTPAAASSGSAGGEHDLLGEAAEGDLRVGALEDGQREAGQHVPAAAERHLGARVARGVGGVGRARDGLDQPRHLAVDHEPPARVAVEPLAQGAGVAADEGDEIGVRPCGAEHGPPQQRPRRPGQLGAPGVGQRIGQRA